MEQIFKVGDVVRLVSGAEPMTVTAASAQGNIRVSWLTNGKLGIASFPAAALRLVGRAADQ